MEHSIYACTACMLCTVPIHVQYRYREIELSLGPAAYAVAFEEHIVSFEWQ
jgi:hypothetical protein